MTSSQLSNPESLASTKAIYRRLPRGIWALGFVSMFMDISSELVHSLLPIFMATVLGASMATIGIVEGVAEGAAAITKVFSGAISDYFRKRKILAVVGYALAAMTKPIFPLAATIGWVFGARLVDRIGKGIRGAPRWSPISRHRSFGARPTVCASPSIRLGPLSGRCSRSHL